MKRASTLLTEGDWIWSYRSELGVICAEAGNEVSLWDYFQSSSITLFLRIHYPTPEWWRWQQSQLEGIPTRRKRGLMYSGILLNIRIVKLDVRSGGYCFAFHSCRITDLCFCWRWPGDLTRSARWYFILTRHVSNPSQLLQSIFTISPFLAHLAAS